MSVRQEVVNDMVIDGKRMTVRLLSHITIDDIARNEMTISAFEMEHGTVDSSRRVNRDVRDYLILIGVER
jgi:hypothetical protein